MCGISGIFHYKDASGIDGSVLRRMAAAVAHRGPDDAGFHEDGPCGFGFRRLSVIDLHTGHQPMLSADGARAVMLNGEIYNYADLRSSFVTDGRAFSTRSDTEVVLAAYERHGTECPSALRGMFAFAVWDRDRRRLFLARDRLGVKPLYYLDDGRRIVFGSEIKAILAAGGVSRAIDPEAVADYFALRYVPGPKSIFKSVRKLPPGCWMLVESGKAPIIQRYWDVRFRADERVSEAEWIERLREGIDGAVRSRMVSDVPIGAFLSGGVDSSAVVATMARFSTAPISTFTVGFGDAATDETAAARLTVNRYRTNHRESDVGANLASVIETLTHHFDEPFADSSAIPMYCVSKAAREQVTVALSGDGGDENFAGYGRRYGLERRRDRLRSLLPQGLRPFVFGTAARLYASARWLPARLRGKLTLADLALDPHVAFFNTMSLGTDRLSRLLSPDLRHSLKGYAPADLFRDLMAASGTSDPVSRAQYADIKTFLADDILVKVDRASMAAGLEARDPMLDHVLVEMAAAIPSKLKLDGRSGKVILKKAVADRVPDPILARPKQGFEAPLGEWLRGPLQDFAQTALFSMSHTPGDGLVDLVAVRRLWVEHQSGASDHAPHLWAVIMFNLWAERFARSD